MEKVRKNKSTSRSPLGSLSRRISNGFIGFLERPKPSLATSAASSVRKNEESTQALDKAHNRSTQLIGKETDKPIRGQATKKGFQDVISKSVASASMMKIGKGPTTPVYKNALKISDSIFSHSVYKMGHSPKGSFASGGAAKPSSTIKNSSFCLLGASNKKKPKKEISSKATNVKPTRKSELHVYDTFQEFLGSCSKLSKAPKEDKGRLLLTQKMACQRPDLSV